MTVGADFRHLAEVVCVKLLCPFSKRVRQWVCMPHPQYFSVCPSITRAAQHWLLNVPKSDLSPHTASFYPPVSVYCGITAGPSTHRLFKQYFFFFFWFLDRLYQVLGSNPHSPERELYQLMNSADTALFGNPSLFTVSEVSLFAAQFL